MPIIKRSTKKSTASTTAEGRQPVGDNAPSAQTIAELSRAMPREAAPTPTPAAPATTTPTTPGKGAYVFKKVGDHLTSAVWDPHAAAPEEAPLRISREDQQLLIATAKRLGVPLVKLADIDPAAVRAARAFAASAPEHVSKYQKYTELVEEAGRGG